MRINLAYAVMTILLLAQGCGTSPTAADNSGGVGLSIIYTKNSDGHIYRRLASGGSEELLTNNVEGGNGGPSWSRDRTQIVFHSTRTGSSQIWIMDADGGNQRQLTTESENWGASFSPDGSRIAFVSIRPGLPQTFTMRTADGGDVQQLTSGLRNDGATWGPARTGMPDGRISFSGPEPVTGNVTVFTMNPTSDPAQQDIRQMTWPSLPDFPDAGAANWSQNGVYLVFWTGREGTPGELGRVNHDDPFNTRVHLTNESVSGWNSDGPAYSYDDTEIIYGSNRLDGVTRTWVLQADGDRRVLLEWDYGGGRIPW